MLVSIIIPTYNGLELLKECLPSVLTAIRHAGPVAEAEIVVADDASGDNTAEWLAKEWPEARLVRNTRNRGFAVTANAGIRAAKGEWLCLLNNDTVVEKEWLSAAAAHFKEPGLGAIASKIVYHENPGVVESDGDDYTVVGVAVKHSNRRPVSCAAKRRSCFSACAASAFYRAEALQAAGGFWELLGAYYEDVELGFRLRLQGWDCVYEPGSVCRHKVTMSYGRRSYFMKFNSARNIELVWFSCMPAGLIMSYLPEHLLSCLVHFAYRLATGRGLSYVHGKLAFLKLLPAVLERRRLLKPLRKIPDAELRSRLDRNWLRSLVAMRMKAGA